MPDLSGVVAEFIEAAQIKLAGDGEPQANLRAPLDTFLTSVAAANGIELTLHDESHLTELGAKPDWSSYTDGVLIGHVEAKAPGKGVNGNRFKGHDREQWSKIQVLPNLLYTDGNSFALHRDGERLGKIVRLDGDLRIGDANPRVASRHRSTRSTTRLGPAPGPRTCSTWSACYSDVWTSNPCRQIFWIAYSLAH